MSTIISYIGSLFKPQAMSDVEDTQNEQVNKDSLSIILENQEILTNVFSFLNLKGRDGAVVAQTCKFWKEVCHDTYLTSVHLGRLISLNRSEIALLKLMVQQRHRVEWNELDILKRCVSLKTLIIEQMDGFAFEALCKDLIEAKPPLLEELDIRECSITNPQFEKLDFIKKVSFFKCPALFKPNLNHLPNLEDFSISNCLQFSKNLVFPDKKLKKLNITAIPFNFSNIEHYLLLQSISIN